MVAKRPSSAPDADRLMQMADEYLGLRDQEPAAEVVDDLDRRIAELVRTRTQRAVEALVAGLPADVMAAAVAEIEAQLAALTTRRAAVEASRADGQARQERAVALQHLAAEASDRLPRLDLQAQGEVLALLRLEVTALGRVSQLRSQSRSAATTSPPR